MNVVFALVREVEVDHVSDVIHVQSSGGHIRGDENGAAARAETTQNPVPDVLAFVAMDSVRSDIVPAENGDEAVHHDFGLSKD